MENLLTGIAWNHSRAFPPLVAAAQRFEETHPGIQIRWSKRSLHEFGHADLATLAGEFDMIVMDHPWIGKAFESGVLLALDERLQRDVWSDWARNSVGCSFESYVWQGRLFAVPIDGAAPVASYRPDLLSAAGFEVPVTWQDVLTLAKARLAVMPGHPVDVFINFLGLCASRGGDLFQGDSKLVDREIGGACLEQLQELIAYMPPEIFGWNPIEVYEQMANSERLAYCPFAYGYSNYSRPQFAQRQILFTNLVSLPDGRPIRSLLGGTGIGISSRCRNAEVALDYATYVASPDCQKSLYFFAGGQPSHRAAWTDSTVNAMSGDFFLNTLRSMDEAWVRPRYAGYVPFQETAGVRLVRYLREGGKQVSLWEDLDRLYRESLGSRISSSSNDSTVLSTGVRSR